MQGPYNLKSNIPGLYLYVTRLLGANGAALSPEEPSLVGGVTHARTDEGVYTMTWAENPGRFIGVLAHQFYAATMADVEDYHFVNDTWPTSDPWTLTYTVYAATTAADLIANQYLTLTVAFAAAGSGY